MRFGHLLGAALIVGAPAVALVGSASCSSDQAEVGAGAGGASSGSSGSGANAGEGGIPLPTEVAPCDGKIYECGDLEDNDDDGLIDAQDPDCTGPCDNTEDSLYPDLPGMTGAPCVLDCFWDNGNGSGNDDCYWDHRCDPLAVAPDYPPEGIDCAYDPEVSVGPFTCDEAFNEQTQDCYDYCVPLVPNGCDCFGCCELPPESGKYVWLQSYDEDKLGTCTLDAVEDPEKCQPCTPVPGCFNGCGRCELCMGKTTLPPDCFDPDGGTDEQCPPELQPCGLPGQDACPTDYYCITGCCIQLPN